MEDFSRLIPYETCGFSNSIVLELERRKKNRSFDFRQPEGWDSENGKWNEYKGPQRAFVRVCSFGKGRPSLKKPGFILEGGKGFYQTYGFQKNNENINQQVIGYTPDGQSHVIDNDKNTSQYPIHVPNPQIVKVETVLQKELFRRAWIHWTCFSSKQLEYMTPYFLIPRMSVIIEFGWNHFNPKSLIDLTDKDTLKQYYFTNPSSLYTENILLSNGNYDVVYGFITNYEWTIEGNKINCMTEVTSKDGIYAGMRTSTTLVEKINPDDPKTEVKYLPNLRKLCDTDFIKNLKTIATVENLQDAEKLVSNLQLYQIIKGSTIPGKSEMKRECWRGIFYGRDDKNRQESQYLDHKWTTPNPNDFDKTPNDDCVWVNMGFLVELMNRVLALPSPKKEAGFFEVDVDGSVIGAHPNLISSDGGILLIPNAMAPKYMVGNQGINQGDYKNQFKEESKRINKFKKDLNNPLWNANYQLTNIFGQDDFPQRDDIDWIINSNRYIYPTDRNYYCFPFLSDEEVDVKNRGVKAKYDAYFYGYFKDLYFNVKHFIELVKNENIKTYNDLYYAIFDDINKAGGNFWEFALVTNDNTSRLVVVDKKMLPSGNNKSNPWYFDYMDSNQLMLSLGFKPKMSEAQACQALFSENNNGTTKTIVKNENDLLNYQFEDGILADSKETPPTTIISTNSNTNPFLEQIKTLQNIEPPNGSYQFTILVNNKPYFRRLALPDGALLNCLLDDHDIERNQRYVGVQPITVEVALQGIGGIRTWMTFLIRNLPDPYNHKDVAYRIVDVHHLLQDGKWDTVIKSGIIPLRGYIKQKLGIKD